MSNIQLIIEERAVSIGKFMVGRLLPFRQKRMVGPFIYIDHMGPVTLSDRENFEVDPHPHIGLSTLTFLFEGSIMHRDTLGNLDDCRQRHSAFRKDARIFRAVGKKHAWFTDLGGFTQSPRTNGS